ncbi:MAG: hypothetical protein CMK59_15590 [Proteobacteria bacterium]|nr:hypothetical protein [Pseudomonadota bacterium]
MVLKTHFVPLKQPKWNLELIAVDESKQETGSFKFRAAWNLVKNVNAEHFLAASSGNFGQALARACQLLNKKATIVMPTTSARVKVEAVKRFGATLKWVDTSIKTRAQRVSELQKEIEGVYVASAYDCPYVIDGNASLGREIAEQNLDIVIVPVGGGGLCSGVIKGLQELESKTVVWGAEPLMANDAARSLRSGELLCNEGEPQTIADGARTRSLGKRNWRIIHPNIAGILEVSEEYIKLAVRQLFDWGIHAEPTGALTTGALLQASTNSDPIWSFVQQKKVGVVISGGNVDSDIFQDLISLD